MFQSAAVPYSDGVDVIACVPDEMVCGPVSPAIVTVLVAARFTSDVSVMLSVFLTPFSGELCPSDRAVNVGTTVSSGFRPGPTRSHFSTKHCYRISTPHQRRMPLNSRFALTVRHTQEVGVRECHRGVRDRPVHRPCLQRRHNLTKCSVSGHLPEQTIRFHCQLTPRRRASP